MDARLVAARLAPAAMLALAFAGCGYNAHFANCEVTCGSGSGGTCPESFTCGADLVCHPNGDDGICAVGDGGTGDAGRPKPTGTFGSGSASLTGGGPVALAVADFDDDMKLDVAFADSDTSQVQFLLGAGAGKLVPSTTVMALAISQPAALATTHLDDDTLVLAVGGLMGAAVFEDHHGMLSMIDSGDFPNNTLVSAVAGDVDGDSHQDLVFANRTLTSASVMYGNGSGTFTDESYPVGALPSAVALGMFGGSGGLDLVSSEPGGAYVATYAGGRSFNTSQMLDVPSAIAAMAVGDIDHNHLSDVVVAATDANTAQVILFEADGSVMPGQTLTLGALPSAVTLVDLDADGFLDLVIGCESGELDVFLYRAGSFTSTPSQYMVGSRVSAIAVADLDGDGVLDLVIGNNGAENAVTVFLGQHE